MLRISCDHCGRSLEQGETHFVVSIEVFAAAPEAALSAADPEEDHMEALSQLLDSAEADGPEPEDTATRALRFDLCPACRQRYLRDPLGKDSAQKLHFSEN